MNSLDDLKKIERIDASNMKGLIEEFPQQCKEAVKIGRNFKISSRYSDIDKILILGMGGSAIGGDLLISYLFKDLHIPLTVNRNYEIPEFVNEKTLVFVISYSGNTEETLTAYAHAKEKQAKVVGLTSGGKLKEYCAQDKHPVLVVPAGFPPRAALGYLFFPLFLILVHLGLVEDQDEAIEETIKILETFSHKLHFAMPFKENKAKQIAQSLYNKVPLIYSSLTFEPVALRWKEQFNENSKVFALWNVFPELNHNEIVGWEFLENILKDFALVLIRDEFDLSRIKARMEITKSLIKGKVGEITEVWTEGKSLLARLFTAIYLGDFVSYYLALLNCVDPTSIKMIDLLKCKLAKI